MLDVYRTIHAGLAVPTKQLACNITMKEAQERFGFTEDEIMNALDGSLIGDTYLIEFSPKFMRWFEQEESNDRKEFRLTSAEARVLKRRFTGAKESEIKKALARELHIADSTFYNILGGALKKLPPEFKGLMIELMESRRKAGIELELVEEITVEIVDEKSNMHLVHN